MLPVEYESESCEAVASNLQEGPLLHPTSCPQTKRDQKPQTFPMFADPHNGLSLGPKTSQSVCDNGEENQLKIVTHPTSTRR